MKKAFTLIELLAVIIILAIVALIATPIILNVIEDSRKSANRSQVEILLSGAENYYAQGLLNGNSFDGTNDIYDIIETTNKKPEDGIIKIDAEGNIYLAIFIDGTCYTKGFNDEDISENDDVTEVENCVPYELPIGTKYDYAYTGSVQEFIVPVSGYYYFEAWGAQGGLSLLDNGTRVNDSEGCLDVGHCLGGDGAYTAGYIYLNKNEKIYVTVGGKGQDGQYQNVSIGGYNGGGNGEHDHKDDEADGAGGGATDFRLEPGNWDDELGLNSRIMVAAGAGGSPSLQKGESGSGLSASITSDSKLTNQTTGYQFGIGQSAEIQTVNYALPGAGGGYYGGYVDNTGTYINPGIGGTSFISGHTGSVAIKSSTDQSPKEGCQTGTYDNNCSIHYSEKVFVNTIMIDGNGYEWTNEKGDLTLMPNPTGGYYYHETGHVKDGYARITFYGEKIQPIELHDVYLYTETEQSIVLEDGKYEVFLSGAQGGSSLIEGKFGTTGGNGAFVSGEIEINETTTLYAHIGGQGKDATIQNGGLGGYNGGGNGSKDNETNQTPENSGGGGGATDLRLVSSLWNNNIGLNSRIIVAAGGGGARLDVQGASGGALEAIQIGGTISDNVYQFGIGQNGEINEGSVGSGGAGGGGGYFGGIGGNTLTKDPTDGLHYHSTGGTSYASGCAGCRSVVSQTDSTITNNPTHYSGLKFENINMEIGKNSGDGYIYILKID